MRAETSSGAERIIFLGGIFPPSQIDFIHRESKGVIQSAADALQKSLIDGIASHGHEMAIVNLPYVGSYPGTFKKVVFPGTVDSVAGVPLFGQSFVDVKFIKLVHRLIGAFRGLQKLKEGKRPDSGHYCDVVLIYSAHLPFILAALAYRATRENCSICVILPDLPEFMSDGGLLYRMAKAVETAIFYRLARRIDYFVVLTQAMAKRLGLSPERYVVMEGIADQVGAGAPMEPGKRIFLYTGTLASRYGITHLVDAFRTLDAPGVELWICGEGDSKENIQAAAAADKRIKFFGQVTRDEARELQKAATILVNPRLPVGEFTKYSFPSKTMEYMASGRPVLMYRLPGVPKEYYDHFVSPADNSVEALARSMVQMIGWRDDALAQFGQRAREFVLREKNANAQTKKIIQLIEHAS